MKNSLYLLQVQIQRSIEVYGRIMILWQYIKTDVYNVTRIYRSSSSSCLENFLF